MKRTIFPALVIVALSVTGCSGCSYRALQKFTLVADKYINLRHAPAAVAHYSAGVKWAEPGGEPLTMDISWPAGPGPFPMIVNIHGGAFFMDTNAIDQGLCRYLTNRGYAVFNINYRLAPQHLFPAAVNDSLGAVVWAKSHAAEYHGDPKRVAVMGGSAGGNLAALVALAWDDPVFTPTVAAPGLDARVQAAVPIFAVWDLTTINFPGSDRPNPYIGASVKDEPGLFRRASPVTYLDAQSPPMLVVCGDQDSLYPQSVDAVERLKKLGVPVELYTAPGKGHAFTNFHWQPEAQAAFKAIGDWLDKTL
jgi:acetyl esterase